MVRLTQIPKGGQAVIAALPHGRNAGIRLNELGLRTGQRITVIAVHPMRGPVIVRAGRTDIALGRRIAESIAVEPLRGDAV